MATVVTGQASIRYITTTKTDGKETRQQIQTYDFNVVPVSLADWSLRKLIANYVIEYGLDFFDTVQLKSFKKLVSK
jgi:hypothetical protein